LAVVLEALADAGEQLGVPVFSIQERPVEQRLPWIEVLLAVAPLRQVEALEGAVVVPQVAHGALQGSLLSSPALPVRVLEEGEGREGDRAQLHLPPVEDQAVPVPLAVERSQVVVD